MRIVSLNYFRKVQTRRLVAALALTVLSSQALAARFTYHGQLLDGDAPASGDYDLRVRAFADAGAKRALGEATELPKIAVKNGSFALELDIETQSVGDTFVEVAVRRSGSGETYETLGAPQAIVKANVGCWALDGNTGLPSGSFLGIAEDVPTPLVLRVRNSPVATLTPQGSASAFGDASSVAFGSSANLALGAGATVSGGGSTRDGLGAACPDCANVATNFGVVSGGSKNTAASHAVVAGGFDNQASGNSSVVGGGAENRATGVYSVVSGGTANLADGLRATVVGGIDNISYEHGFVGGGEENVANDHAVVLGGRRNLALGNYSSALGGYFNATEGDRSVVAGGENNFAGGDYSFAAGYAAVVRTAGQAPIALPFPRSTLDYSGTASGDDGSFVWSDRGAGGIFRTSGANQFLVRAQGGVGINTAPPSASVELSIESDADDPDYSSLWLKQRSLNDNGVLLSAGDGSSNNAGFYIDHYNGITQARRLELATNGSVTIRSNTTAAASGVTMPAGSGAWNSLSDRRLKTAIAAIDPVAILERLLATPITTWSYRAQGNEVRHIGPMAQDFAAAFGLGENDTTISTVDADGVALAAIQGLHAKLESENAELRAANAAMQAKMEALMTRMAELEASID